MTRATWSTAATVLATTGCPAPCEGVACEGLYDGTLLATQQGGARLSGEHLDPLQAPLLGLGTNTQGVGWSAVITPGALVIGTPELSEVQVLTPGDGALSLDALRQAMIDGGDAEGFGAALAAVPDTDGDGTAELLVGAPAARRGSHDLEAGAAYLFTGLVADPTEQTDLSVDDAALALLAERAFDHLGTVVAGCADLDGDSLGDFAVTATWGDSWDTDPVIALAGQVHLVLSSELSSLPAEMLVGELDRGWYGARTGEQLGRTIACRHDLAGLDSFTTPDGQADLLLGAPFAGYRDDRDGDGEAELLDGAGAVYILPGGDPASWATGLITDDATVTLRGPDAGDHFGAALATGDLTGDGYPELAVGAPGGAAGAGEVYVFHNVTVLANDQPQFVLRGDSDLGHLGARVVIDDLDGDGLGDLLVGAPRSDPFPRRDAFAAGALYIFYGRTDFEGVAALQGTANADASLAFPQQFLQVGGAIITGDLDRSAGAELVLLMRYDPDQGIPSL